ncbi:MAG TPA: hypothetical protein VNP97_05575, partial [Microbacterium sp.]|nr:hypothetical protein [Microbacterium sp.]
MTPADAAANSATTSSGRPTVAALLRSRWPSALGVVMIAATSFRGADVYVVALVTMLAALAYLSAAATSRRRAAWIAFATTAVFVPVGVITRIDLTVPIVAVAALLIVYGLATLERTSWRELGIQAAGFAAFTAVSVIALNLGPAVAAYVAALGVIGHGVWDVVHHRRDKAVTRAFSEFCAVL